MSSCNPGFWQGLDFANEVTLIDSYDVTDYAGYWQQSVMQYVVTAIVFCSLAAAMLLGLTAWRLARCCARRKRARRGRRTAAAGVLAGRVYWGLKLAAVLLAGGTIAEDYLGGTIIAANGTVAAGQALDSWLLETQVKMQQLPGVNASSEVLAEVNRDIRSVHDTIQRHLGDVRTALGYLQVRLLDRVQKLHLQWSSTVTILDITRQGLLYLVYGLLVGGVALLALGMLINCPGLAVPALFASLALLLLAWAAVGASTAAMKVGYDGCENLDQIIADRLHDLAAREAAAGDGTSILARAGANGTVIEDTTGLNVDQLLGTANDTVWAAQDMVTNPKVLQRLPALANLAAPVNRLTEGVAALASNVTALEGRLSRDAFFPVYAEVKGFFCCEAMNWAGWLWLALLASGCCLTVLCAAALWWLARFDRLEPRASCHCYRLADYRRMEEEGEGESEGEEERGGAGGAGAAPLELPALPASKPSSLDVEASLPGRIRAKEQQLAAWRAAGGGDAAGGAGGAGGDQFSLRAVYSEDAVLLSSRSTPRGALSARGIGGGNEAADIQPAASAPAGPADSAGAGGAVAQEPAAAEEEAGSAGTGRGTRWTWGSKGRSAKK
eukprot:scaffold11.g3869.t1